jgi:hypothetical protein
MLARLLSKEVAPLVTWPWILILSFCYPSHRVLQYNPQSPSGHQISAIPGFVQRKYRATGIAGRIKNEFGTIGD